MSADPDRDTACPRPDIVVAGAALAEGDSAHDPTDIKRKKPSRSVRFPDDNQLVTQYFEPANPWHDVPTTTRAQLAAEYLEACRRHNTQPIDSVLQQIREFPENAIGGSERAARLTLSTCSLVGAAPADALEAVLRKVQFRRVEVEHAEVDDEGAEALFDMIEYYESANVVCISGPRQFGIRGWQAACRMIKKSADLSEIEVCESALCASHAPVLVRALRPHTCRLRALCLQRASLQGEPLLCLVIALKSNSSIRELRLPDNELTAFDAQQLGSLLRFNLNVQLLDLSNNQIQDAGAGYIADALVDQADQTPPSAATSPLSPHHFPLGYESRVGLAFLVLWNNQLTRLSAPHLSKALRSSQSLCVLNIGRNALGTECVRALCGGGAVVSLGLQCARLGPEAARPLADLVRADTKLQRLDLRDNRLGVVGLQAIFNAMKENTTLTQIDLDDPVESSTLTAEDSSAATAARLTRDIAALCRRNEPPATEPERRVLRRISLTCHTAALAKTGPSAAEAAWRTSRLRSPAPSPAPSPAGSPTPHNQHTSRFSVTRVTPERELSAETTSPSTPTRTYGLTPSRFKVVQVEEPPQIQVSRPGTQKRPPSRFSVTRNYDAIYDSPTSPRTSPAPSLSPVLSYSPTLGSFSASPTPVCSRSPTEPCVSPTVIISDCTTPGNLIQVANRVFSDPSDPTLGVLSYSPIITDWSITPACERVRVVPSVAGVQTTATPEPSSGSPTVVSSGSPMMVTATPINIKGSAISESPSSVSTGIEMSNKCSKAELVMSGVNVSSTLIAGTGGSATVSPMPSCETSIGHEPPIMQNFEVGARPNVEFATQILEKNMSSGMECFKDSSNIETCANPDTRTIAVEDIWRKDAVRDETRVEIPSTILSGTPSDIAMIGTVSKTSTVTLTGSNSSGTPSRAFNSDTDSIISFKECDVNVDPRDSYFYYSNEPLIKLTEKGPSPINMQRILGATAVPYIIKAVPNSRFSISPIPDNADIFQYEETDINDISKSVAKGSHTNIATETNRKNMEADILTKIAEIAETIGPKVVEIEPKDVHKAIETEETRLQMVTENKPTLETLTSLCRDVVSKPNTANTAATSLIDVSSNIDFSECKDNKSVTDRVKQHTMPIDEYKSQDTRNKILFTEQIETEKQDTHSDVKDRRTTDDIKQTEVSEPIKETVKHKDIIDKFGSKPILKELKHSDYKIELSKSIAETIIEDAETCEGDDVFKLDGNNAASRVTDSGKDNSDAKKSDPSDDSGKNKSYSDVVKSDPKYKDKSEQLTHREEISDSVVKTETNLVRNSVEVTDSDKVDVKVEVTVKKESVQNATKVHSNQNKDFVNIDDIIIKKDGRTMKQIEAITEDLGNLIQEMKHMSSKSRKVKSDCTVGLGSVDTNKVPGNFNRDVVLKKNKSESSLDSPDLEVSRLMNKKLVGSPFCDSSSSLEISGSSMESLNAIENQHVCQIPKHVVIQESIESDSELDRRKSVALSTENSVESTSEVTPVNTNFLNMSVSSNESVSPIIFGKKKKIHDSLSSLEASMSSLDSGRQEKVMMTSADSGIEYSLQQPSENKEDNSSNEGTLTHNSSLKETVKKDQETLTSSPKRASSLLDVPALKTKGLDRMRKISWVAPSSSFHIPRVEPEKFEKPSHLEKLLSIFQHPTSLFSRGSQSEEERKSASNTPPRKDSSLSSSFWSWGSTVEKDKEDKEDSSEATDSTLSERVQVSFVDESFSKKLDSKTPSTDTDNTLSEFQSFPTQTEDEKKVTDDTTDENLVQSLGLSLNTDKAGNGNRDTPKANDTTDLNKPNDLNRNYEIASDGNAAVVENKSETRVIIDKDDCIDEVKIEPIRPRSFAAVLKSSGSENTLDKQPSPDSGQPVDKLPSKVIRGIKENISPENTLTSSMTNTKTLAFELTERQVKNQAVVNTVWEVTGPMLDKSEPKVEEIRTTEEVTKSHDLAPIATIEETCDEAADNMVNIQLDFIDDIATDEKLEPEKDKAIAIVKKIETVDLGKDALSYMIYESQDFEPDTEHTVAPRQVEASLAQELKDAEIKEMLDLSPELVIDETVELPVLTATEIKGMRSSPVIPERAKLKKSNSLEDLSQREAVEQGPKTKTIAFQVPETSPRDIPDRRPKLRTMSGSSPKSLPESLNKPSALVKLDTALKKRKKISSLGKIAKDSLLALNMNEDEIAEYRRSYVTSVESLRSLESVSEDANSQSGTSVDSRCRACLRTSQESLMSLDSITEDCKCVTDSEKPGRSAR